MWTCHGMAWRGTHTHGGHRNAVTITCAGAGHCLGNGAAGDRPVPVHDLLKLHFAHRGRWRAEFTAAQEAHVRVSIAPPSPIWYQVARSPPAPSAPSHLLWL